MDESETPKRKVVTLSPRDATKVDRLAARLNVTVPDALRLGLSLLDLYAGLTEDESLGIIRVGGRVDAVVLAR